MKSAALIASFFLTINSDANPLLIALAQIETGANTPKQCPADMKIGRNGELSRYQIKPVVWNHSSKSKKYFDPKISGEVAKRILQERILKFNYLHRRKPTLKEIYCLWNAPAYMINSNGKLLPIPKNVKERCQRFENLIKKYPDYKPLPTL